MDEPACTASARLVRIRESCATFSTRPRAATFTARRPTRSDSSPAAIEGRAVLDVGCGFGWFELTALDRSASSIVGLEISKSDLRDRSASQVRALAGGRAEAVCALPDLRVVVVERV